MPKPIRSTPPRDGQVAVLGHGGFRSLAYYEWGPRAASRTVVCVHGVSRSGRDFDALASALGERGVRVIVPDLPGRGRSEWLATAEHYTDRAYTGAMSTLIARLDTDEVDWIGTSLGGHIGMLLAAQRATPIRRLVLNDFGARVSAAGLRRIGGYLARTWRFKTLEEVEAHLREALAPFGALSDAQWHHVAVHSAVRDPESGWRFHFDPAIGARFGVPIWLDIVLWHIWDRIECPVLILRGADSDLLSAHTVEQMLSRGPAAEAGKVRAVEFAGCGHAPALMEREQIAAIEDFLYPGSASRLQAAPEQRVRTVRTAETRPS